MSLREIELLAEKLGLSIEEAFLKFEAWAKEEAAKVCPAKANGWDISPEAEEDAEKPAKTKKGK
jgi:hypothetical protein